MLVRGWQEHLRTILANDNLQKRQLFTRANDRHMKYDFAPTVNCLLDSFDSIGDILNARDYRIEYRWMFNSSR